MAKSVLKMASVITPAMPFCRAARWWRQSGADTTGGKAGYVGRA